MRILEFNVDKQRLTKKAECDFSGLVAGTTGYLHAKFYFSANDWANCTTKIARFWVNDVEHSVILDVSGSCVIPAAALTGSKFEVSVLGAAPGYTIGTNRVTVRQEVC